LTTSFQRSSRPVGAERSRLNQHHLNPKRRDFSCERLRQALHGKFSRVVIPETRNSEQACVRGNVDDAAPAPLAHAWKRHMDHSCEAKKIGIDHGADFAFFAFFHCAYVTIPGIVYEHIDAAKSSFGFFYSFARFRLI